MKFKLFLCLMVLFYIFTNTAYGFNSIKFNNIGIENGLSQGTVETIIQDKKGYIWLGTNEGLDRYNGSEIKPFKFNNENTENTIISNYITDLEVDNNTLWIATVEGVSRINLNDYTIKNYTYSSIVCMYTDSNGNLYTGTHEGVVVYNREKDTFDKLIFTNGSLNDENVFSITEDKESNLWIGTQKGICKLDKNTKEITSLSFNKEDTADWGKIYTLTFDNNNNLWIGTEFNGLKKLNLLNNKVETFTANLNDPNKLNSNTIRDILVDSNNNIWIATELGLSKYIKDDKFITYTHKESDKTSLINDIVYTIIEDKNGLIWVGTIAGVSVFDLNIETKIYRTEENNTNSLSSNVVFGVYEDNQKLLWVGTRDKGLNIIDQDSEKITHIYEGKTEYELSSNNISVIKGKDNIIWVGTRNGLNKIDKTTMKIEKYTTYDGLVDNNIKSLLVDSKNNLWIGTSMGLNVLKINTNEIIDITPKISTISAEIPYIQEIYEDKENAIWLGGYSTRGLIKMDSNYNILKTYSVYKIKGKKKEIKINTVRQIIEDNYGTYWIGTNSGLLKFDKNKETFKSYNEESGLSNNVVYQILIDDKNNLWMSTNNGISMFNPKLETFITLTSENGLQGNEFNGTSACKCQNGDLAFGGTNGLSVFNPTKIISDDTGGNVQFNSFQVGNKEYFDINNKSFKYNENFMRIKFFYNNYKNKKIKYMYKLEGLNKDWISINNSQVIFNNLPVGNYTFKIKAINSNGTESPESSVSFRIKPAWWLSTFAKFSYITLLILFILYHLNKKVKKIEELDNTVNERTKQLNCELKKNKMLYEQLISAERKKNNYFINLSHELKTPLNVLSSIEQVIRSLNINGKLESEKVNNYMEIMKKNISRLLNLINNILDTSKLENGKYVITKTYNDIVYLVEETALGLKQSIESEGIKLIIDTDVEEKMVFCDKDDIERCIVNLLSNAQKYTPPGGTITVNIYDLIENVKIVIEDTGVGIDKKYHETIFDRFNQIVNDESETKEGTGLGLTITKQILDLHNATIKLESETNKGTKFTIILPVE